MKKFSSSSSSINAVFMEKRAMVLFFLSVFSTITLTNISPKRGNNPLNLMIVVWLFLSCYMAIYELFNVENISYCVFTFINWKYNLLNFDKG